VLSLMPLTARRSKNSERREGCWGRTSQRKTYDDVRPLQEPRQEVALFHASATTMRIDWFRPFTVHGRSQTGEMLLPYAFSAAARDEPAAFTAGDRHGARVSLASRSRRSQTSPAVPCGPGAHGFH
jgi:hypothetical protein